MQITYPDLSKEKVISIDIETYDPKLREYGSGVYRRDGYILGVSLATESGFSEYYNVGHPDCPTHDFEINKKYLADVLSLDIPKLGANLLYDIDWLENFFGIKVNGRLHDVQVAEPLLNEYLESYSLDSLARKYLGEGKFKSEIQDFCDENGLKGDSRLWLWQMPYELVRQYAKIDAVEPLKIFKFQQAEMQKQGLYEIYLQEMKLYRVLLMMRKNGTRIDTEYVSKITEELEIFVRDKTAMIHSELGYGINFNSSKQMAELFDDLGLPYDRKPPTAIMIKKGITEGNPSIDAKRLDATDHHLIQSISNIKKYEKARSTFFVNSFTNNRVGDRIHTNFYPVKGNGHGTISGRLSSANPNLQQIPSKDKIIGPMCRKAFIPEDGKLWFKIDWSQVEYRILAHYAEGPGADKIRAAYNDDPNTDYHQQIMDLTGLDRKLSKNLNFGVAYFMGIPALSSFFGWSLEYAGDIYRLYHEKVPFLRYTQDKVMRVAKTRGYIKTILGRIARVERGKEYKIFNRLIQGSAADIMKEAMVQIYEEGLFETITLQLTVHDEIDGSFTPNIEEAKKLWRVKEIMETCVKLSVPLKSVLEVGKNWAELKECNTFEELLEEIK